MTPRSRPFLLAAPATAAAILFGLAVGGVFFWVEAHPCFQGWRDLYQDYLHNDGQGFAACQLQRDPEYQARMASESERQRTEAARREAWMQAVQPWHQASRARRQGDREEWARYELEMSTAPALCRESMRSRLPVGWSAATIALGRSESGSRYRTWTVSGWTTITHADGSQRRYEYRCDLSGSTVIGLMLTDRNGREEFLVPDVRP